MALAVAEFRDTEFIGREMWSALEDVQEAVGLVETDDNERYLRACEREGPRILDRLVREPGGGDGT